MMKNKDRLIFVTNDDGFSAKGFQVALEVAREFGRVVAVAPATMQSGRSQAITMYDPLFLEEQQREEGLEVYSLSGTPVDCVKLAMFELLPRCPDLVIGGINHGDNSAVNVHYSGTMGVVIEGCLKGVPAIGYSLCDHDADADFGPMLTYVRRIAEEVLKHGLPKGTCLNVNAPKGAELKGVRICRQTDASWGNEWCRGQHPKGGEYFWLTGKFTNNEPEAEESDR